MSIDDAQLQAPVQTALGTATEARVELIKQEMPRFLTEWRKFRDDFEQRLYERWAPALDLYESIVALAQETGAAFNRQHRPQAVREKDYVFDALTRLHARACLTASEIGALLRGGYATGALARQRTLHELAVVAAVIRQHGQDIAERYLLHEAIEAVKAAKEYQDNCVRLGMEPLTPEELQRIQHRRDELCRRFGESYRHQYGWAASALKNGNPKITDLETEAGLDHLRPYYRMASHGIHPNSKGLFFNIENSRSRDLMLAGPSNSGLADPGHVALISLVQCTASLLTVDPDIEETVTLQALNCLVDEAGQAFLQAHRDLINAELAIIREEGGKESHEAYLLSLLENMDGPSGS